MTKYALVGDVGGTNARLALCDIASGEISQAKTYSGLDYPSLEAVIRVYLEEHKVEVKDGCIAIACPITGDWVAMTNHTWAFSIAEMKKNLGFSHLEIINDFTAVSMAIPMLKKEHLIQFGGAEPVEGKPIAVYGAGTGLGVAHLVHVDKRWVSLPGEGGHVDFAPNSEEEGIILEILRAEIGHVSAERVLSGPGLVICIAQLLKPTTACQKISSQKILPNARWLTAAPIAAARCRCFASLWAVLAAIWRSISGHLAACLLRVVSCRASLSSSKPLVSAPHLKIKGALKNMSMIFRCISSSMTIRVFSVPVHIYARP